MPIKFGPNAQKVLTLLYDIQQTTKFETTGQNRQGGNYSYYKLSDLLEPIKPLLRTHQCIVVFNTESYSCNGSFQKIQGAKDAVPRDRLVTIADCTVTCRFQSIADREDWVESLCYGFKVDQTADKALGANTIASRYALMNLVIPDSDIDPDSDEHDVRSSGLLGSLTEPAPVNKPTSVSSVLNPPGSSALTDALSLFAK